MPSATGRCPRPARGRPLDCDLATKLVFLTPLRLYDLFSKTATRQFIYELTCLFFRKTFDCYFPHTLSICIFLTPIFAFPSSRFPPASFLYLFLETSPSATSLFYQNFPFPYPLAFSSRCSLTPTTCIKYAGVVFSSYG